MCQIGFRSGDKLKDHVEFSPLHGKMLEKLQQADPAAVAKPAKCKLLHEDLQLFWRIGVTLQVNIYSNIESDTITIIVLDPSDEEAPSASVVADLPKVQDSVRYLQKRSISTSMVEFLRDRISVKREEKSGFVASLKCLHDDPYECVLSDNHDGTHNIPVRIRRIPTIADAKRAVEHFKKEALELKVAREYADKLSESARLSLVAFKHLAQDISARKDKHREASSAWLNAYTKLHHKAGVLQTRARLMGKTRIEAGAALQQVVVAQAGTE